jgi:hypothetical protein
VSTSVVTWSEVLSNRVSTIIRIYTSCEVCCLYDLLLNHILLVPFISVYIYIYIYIYGLCFVCICLIL